MMRRPESESPAEDELFSEAAEARGENRLLQARLAAVTEEVSRNDSLLRKTQERELELLRAGSLTQLFERLIEGLRTSYQLDEVALILHDPQHEIRHLLSGGDAITVEGASRSVLRRCPDDGRAATRQPRAPLARAFPQGRSRAAAAGACALRQPRAHSAAPPRAARRRAGVLQPRSVPLHDGAGERLPRAPGPRGRDLRRERGEPRPTAAQRAHRLPHRLPQPPLPARTAARGAGPRAARPPFDRVPDDRCRSFQAHQRPVRTSRRRCRAARRGAAHRCRDAHQRHRRALRRR